MPDEFIQRFGDPSERLQRLRIFWDERLAEGIPEHGLTLELGCGHGHWLAAYAERHPERLCVGVDLITKRVERASRKKHKRDLPRLHFIKAEATECLKAIPSSAKVNETVLLFPDPWPKKRHHKRRLISESFLDLLAERSLTGSKFYYRTDHEDYFLWTKEKMIKHKAWRLLSENQPWPLEHETFFQNILPNHKSIVSQII